MKDSVTIAGKKGICFISVKCPLLVSVLLRFESVLKGVSTNI